MVKRQPPGTPQGGQFAPSPAADIPEAALPMAPGEDSPAIRRIADWLETPEVSDAISERIASDPAGLVSSSVGGPVDDADPIGSAVPHLAKKGLSVGQVRGILADIEAEVDPQP